MRKKPSLSNILVAITFLHLRLLVLTSFYIPSMYCHNNITSSRSFSFKLLRSPMLNFFQYYFFSFGCFIFSSHQDIFMSFLTFYFTAINFFLTLQLPFIKLFFIFTISFLILTGNTNLLKLFCNWMITYAIVLSHSIQRRKSFWKKIKKRNKKKLR